VNARRRRHRHRHRGAAAAATTAADLSGAVARYTLRATPGRAPGCWRSTPGRAVSTSVPAGGPMASAGSSTAVAARWPRSAPRGRSPQPA